MKQQKPWLDLFNRVLVSATKPRERESPIRGAFRRTLRRAVFSILLAAIVLVVILVVRALTEGK